MWCKRTVSVGVVRIFSRGGNSGEIPFYQLNTNRKTVSLKNYKKNIKFQNPGWPRPPCHPPFDPLATPPFDAPIMASRKNAEVNLLLQKFANQFFFRWNGAGRILWRCSRNVNGDKCARHRQQSNCLNLTEGLITWHVQCAFVISGALHTLSWRSAKRFLIARES